MGRAARQQQMARQRSSVWAREQSHCDWRRRGSARMYAPQQSGATARSAARSRASWYCPPMLAQSRARSREARTLVQSAEERRAVLWEKRKPSCSASTRVPAHTCALYLPSKSCRPDPSRLTTGPQYPAGTMAETGWQAWTGLLWLERNPGGGCHRAQLRDTLAGTTSGGSAGAPARAMARMVSWRGVAVRGARQFCGTLTSQKRLPEEVVEGGTLQRLPLQQM
mmetsp:Transcript_34858/g.73063  ORF Transcript_34858/g.73063 Transcript_34858/m.73063 type:complete len:224 (-) Transcript_34858:332-1003(-)